MTEATPKPETFKQTEKTFHDHLDRCERCRNQPMNLCQEGAALLLKAIAAT